jgi:UPF0176 protein
MADQSSNNFEVFSFYKYVTHNNPEAQVDYQKSLCHRLDLAARIIIAEEGINGVLSGPANQCQRYREILMEIPGFRDINFKVASTDKPYLRKIRVKHKHEIVNSALQATRDQFPPKQAGSHLTPSEFKAMKDRSDTVILDVRSDYETTIGHFKNALTLPISTFRELSEHMDELADYKDKKILTYCTGGIKCEKATAMLKAEGFEEVYQLEGGILNYAQKEKGEDFEGKCYVFDERVVIDVNQVNPSYASKCLHCGKLSARMINCANAACHQQVVICEDCGWEWEGCCSRECLEHPLKRPYDGTGYYPRSKTKNVS